MLKINDKTFLNIQEAVQWLMDNNALPFQCTANYAANTEIGLGTIVNPTMAKVRIGSLIFFADSKVSTVTGVTSNGFIVSDQYNDLVDDVVYVSNVAQNASGHLIVTLSNGTQIDAGLIKQVSSFFINGSQHLIVTYNDGTTGDLGAIFNGSIYISGNISATGNISANGTISGKTPVLTADEEEITAQKPIVEVMNGYSITVVPQSNLTLSYVGVCKNGNKLTIAFSGMATKGANFLTPIFYLAIPAAVCAKLVPNISDYLVENELYLISNQFNLGMKVPVTVRKVSTVELLFTVNSLDGVADSTDYYFRHEVTFLLSENLVA